MIRGEWEKRREKTEEIKWGRGERRDRGERGMQDCHKLVPHKNYFSLDPWLSPPACKINIILCT